jgi:hypothetical protein
MKTLLLAMLLFASAALAVPPTVSNIRATQRAGTKLVDILYDVADPDSALVTVQVEMSSDSGVSYDLPLRSVSGAIGAGVTPGANRQVTWNAGNDWNGNFSLFDMAGNLGEMCWDWNGSAPYGQTDPTGPATGGSRRYRGGSWGDSSGKNSLSQS